MIQMLELSEKGFKAAIIKMLWQEIKILWKQVET